MSTSVSNVASLAVRSRESVPAAAAPLPEASFDFRPLPWLGNPHVQTLLATYLPSPACPDPDRQWVVWLPDGDGLVLHDNVPRDWRPGDPMALVVHGLTGSHESGHVQRLALRLLRRNVRAVRIDLRGAGKGLRLARGSYHGGRSDDIRAALEEMHRWSPDSPLLLAGVSLGGNLVLKLAGEAASHPVPQLSRVVAQAPPIDLGRCAHLLTLPGNKMYADHFLGELIAHARQRQRCFPDLPPLRFPRQMTLRLLDELYTAPRGGFRDADDYYTRGSSAPLIPHIQVPTLILTARDDPFIAVEPFEELRVPSHVHVRILPQGGHVGFLGWDGVGGIRWAERRMVDWLMGI
jgi:predicted alpha/beta-fold hydrolase